ncbi:MAG: KUP/HAK/KT family potassium transporter [Comamonadaceae bacterium]|nr:KUP/HAK/KT family potassium transporter [Burkholderiales bacterium]MEB2349708.1 KUP/HAK/KT family potassium transporter [Comamonadaceae bacterium]
MSELRTSLPTLVVGALGVVFGDIGTSVLYTVKEVFGAGHVPYTPDNVYGVLSLIFWTLTIVVSVKYVALVLRADNHGEGGLVAMLTLASSAVADRPLLRRGMLLVGIFGTCLFYGDGVITPAITTLGAIEGLTVVSPQLTGAVVPLTLVVLLALFAVQKRGTAGIGRYFGLVMVLWFVVIALLGVRQIAAHPQILRALLPQHAAGFVMRSPGVTFVILGAVVLCVTGCEALYADMGHFGKRPIRLAWFGVAMPALVLNYFGQGALLLARGTAAVENPFFHMAPDWAALPLVALATAAAVIASQALISGAYSVTKQVIQLGFLPHLKLYHTSVRALGQIYMPLVNWGLFALIVFAVAMFRSSNNLAAAYGVAVTTDMLITTVLTYFVVRYAWNVSLLLSLAATGVFLTVDLLFWSSNLLKLIHGGWFPLAIAGAVFILMVTWRDGRELLHHALQDTALDLRDFLESLFAHPPLRVPGTAVFLSAEAGIVPNALLHNLKHNKVLHEQNLFVSVHQHEVPWIGMDKRLQVEALGHDCWQVGLHYGFKNDPDLPKALGLLAGRGIDLDPMTTSYFLSRHIVAPSVGTGLAPWREKLFAYMHQSATAAAEYLNLPNNAVVELGSKVEI